MRRNAARTLQRRTSSFGGSGTRVPYSSRMSPCRSQKSVSLFFSSTTFLCTEMLTIEPVFTPGGSSKEGNSMRWARSPRSIYGSALVSGTLRNLMLNTDSHPGIYAEIRIVSSQVHGEIGPSIPSLPTVNMKLS